MSMTTRTADPERLLSDLGSRPVSVPAGLVERTIKKLEGELARRRRVKRFVIGRLTLAAFVTFPMVVAVNALEAYFLYQALDRFLPSSVAGAVSGFAVLSMLLTLALAYGSLPILANVGLKLREQTS